MTFQIRFKELLEEKEVTYSFVAQKTGIPVTTLSNYINRGSTPSMTQLSMLADFFGCSIDYLIGREDDFGVIHAAPVHDSGLNPLNPIEEELVENFRKLDYYQQKAISIQTKALAEDNANTANKVIKK